MEELFRLLPGPAKCDLAIYLAINYGSLVGVNLSNINVINRMVPLKFARPIMYAYNCSDADIVNTLLKYKPKLYLKTRSSYYSLLVSMLEDYEDEFKQPMRHSIFNAYVMQYNLNSKSAIQSFKEKYLNRAAEAGSCVIPVSELSIRFDKLLQSYLNFLCKNLSNMPGPEWAVQQQLFLACSGAAALTADGKSLLLNELGGNNPSVEKINFLLAAGADVALCEKGGDSVLSAVLNGLVQCSNEIINCMVPALLKALAEQVVDGVKVGRILNHVLHKLPELAGRPELLNNFIVVFLELENASERIAMVLEGLIEIEVDGKLLEAILSIVADKISKTKDMAMLSRTIDALSSGEQDLLIYKLVKELMGVGVDRDAITALLPGKFDPDNISKVKDSIVDSVMEVHAPLERLRYCEFILFDKDFPFHFIMMIPQNVWGPASLTGCSLEKGSLKRVRLKLEEILQQDRQRFPHLNREAQVFYTQSLAAAIADNNADEITRLHQLGVNVNAPLANQYAPLMQALLLGKFKAAKALLALQAEVNVATPFARAALLTAVKQISRSAVQNCTSWLVTQVGEEVSVTAMDLARIAGDRQVINLIEQRAQVLQLQNNNNAVLPEVLPPSYQALQSARIRAGEPPSYAEAVSTSSFRYSHGFFSQPASVEVPPPSYWEAVLTSHDGPVPARVVEVVPPAAPKSSQFYPWHLLSDVTVNLEQRPGGALALSAVSELAPVPSAPEEAAADSLLLQLPEVPTHPVGLGEPFKEKKEGRIALNN